MSSSNSDGLRPSISATISRTVPFALEGLSRAFLSELLYTGDPVSAERALQGGLINAVVMDSRGIYIARDRAEVDRFGKPLLANLDRKIGRAHV